jgi:hypothetical protein
VARTSADPPVMARPRLPARGHVVCAGLLPRTAPATRAFCECPFVGSELDREVRDGSIYITTCGRASNKFSSFVSRHGAWRKACCRNVACGAPDFLRRSVPGGVPVLAPRAGKPLSRERSQSWTSLFIRRRRRRGGNSAPTPVRPPPCLLRERSRPAAAVVQRRLRRRRHR